MVALFLSSRAFLPVIGNNQSGGQVTYCREGGTGTVTIHDAGSSRLLSTSGADVAGTTFVLHPTQGLQAQVSLFRHRDPRNALRLVWKDDTGPLAIDFPPAARGIRYNPMVPADLAEVRLGSPLERLDCFLLGPDAIRR